MVTIVVAQDSKGLIGKGDTLPWTLPAGMKHFRELTTGHAVIMGRKTWESLPPRYRPLPDRYNIVISKSYIENPDQMYASLPVVSELEEADKIHYFDVRPDIETAIHLAMMKTGKEVFIIGGASIYREALEKQLVHRMIVSEIQGDYTGNVYFPLVDGLWKCVRQEIKSPRVTVSYFEKRH